MSWTYLLVVLCVSLDEKTEDHCQFLFCLFLVFIYIYIYIYIAHNLFVFDYSLWSIAR
jgi:uncharacterized membrane protein